MHTSSLGDQIHLARSIGVPVTRVDEFVAYTRNTPIHSIIDVHLILKRMRMDTRKVNAIANAYLNHMIHSRSGGRKKSRVARIVRNR
jgi:hypothetical protein